MCCGVQSLPPIEAYIPSKTEIKNNLYGLFSTIISTSMIFNIARGILSAGGFLLSFVAYKAVDYFTDLFCGKLSEGHINLIKTLIKVAGTALSVVASIFMFGYSVEVLLVMLGLYLIFTAVFKLIDPLNLPGGCLRSAI